MSESEYEDGSGDDGQAMETDSLENLRVRCRKSAVLFTVLTVALSCWADDVEIGVLGAKSPDATPATMGRAGSEARAKIVTKKTCLFAIQILDRKHELLKKQT
jgi:hypothetical protein